jgi:hypothetical protein
LADLKFPKDINHYSLISAVPHVANWVEYKSIPLLSKERGGCAIDKKTPFLSGVDGVVSNFNIIRCASRFLDNHPVRSKSRWLRDVI